MSDKVKNIINEEFDSRMGLAVIQYLCEQVGIDKAKEITDEQIEHINGNGFMTQDFCQSMVRCARRIARECGFITDIVPYLINEWGHLTGHITQKRTAEILVAYIDNDLYDAEPGYVRDTLVNRIGVDDDELKDLGLFDWLGFNESEDE